MGKQIEKGHTLPLRPGRQQRLGQGDVETRAGGMNRVNLFRRGNGHHAEPGAALLRQTKRAETVTTLALLCSRASAAPFALNTSAARMPLHLLAAMHMPTPLPQMSTPSSAFPE